MYDIMNWGNIQINTDDTILYTLYLHDKLLAITTMNAARKR